MSVSYAIVLFGIFSTLTALLAFVWAASRGQLRASESAKFFVLDRDELEVTPPTIAPRRARWLVVALVFVFLSIAASTVLTVLTATQASAPPTGSPTSAAKCPF